MVLHNEILLNLAKKIEQALQKKFPEVNLPLEEIYSHIGEPPSLELGHFAFACFPLAKICKTAPNNVSKILSEEIKEDELVKIGRNVGPYLNFFLKPGQMAKIVAESILSGSFFAKKLVEPAQKILIEYSQPNTHKVLHVGHMRNLCLGNSMVRIFRYSGHAVVANTYPGDVGTHVAKCLWYLKNHNKEDPPEKNKGEWLGQIYTKASNLLEEQKGTEQEAKNREELTHILKDLESKKGAFYDQWKVTRKWSLELFETAYKWADVTFDKWYFESEVDSSSLERAKKYLTEGKYIKSDGAVGVDLGEKLGFCMMIKTDGTGMYATKDIELAFRKQEEFKPDRSLYIVDKRQALHFQQIFAVLERLGLEGAKNCQHLQYDFVELPDGAMSSRKGNIIPLMELINQMEKTIKTDYLERYRGDWSDEEINSTASMVAGGAIKYGMLRMDNNRKIVFDMKDWLRLEGETGPYLQYVHARIYSLCEKLGYTKTKADKLKWELLSTPSEEALLVKLTHFNSVVSQACEQTRASGLCGHLFELGKLFNNFYVECPIGKAESEDLKLARLALAKAVGLTMEKGLSLLGIKAPKRM